MHMSQETTLYLTNMYIQHVSIKSNFSSQRRERMHVVKKDKSKTSLDLSHFVKVILEPKNNLHNYKAIKFLK